LSANKQKTGIDRADNERRARYSAGRGRIDPVKSENFGQSAFSLLTC
jgi:hypothetical protein